MPNIPPENQKDIALLKKNSMTKAIVIGLITAALVFYILDQQAIGFRLFTAVAGGVIVAIAKYRRSIKAGVKSDAKNGDETE